MDEYEAIFPKLFPTQLQALIIEELLQSEGEFFTVSQMARTLDVSSSAVSSRISKIKELGIIQILPAKRAKIFRLDEDSEVVKILKEMYKQLNQVTSSPT